MDKSKKILQQTAALKAKVEGYDDLVSKYEEINTIIEMGREEADEELLEEAKTLKTEFLQEYDDLKISTLLDGEYDKENAIVTLHAGEGGTEACDWVSMLFRMYTRWAEKRGFDVETLDYLEGDEAGIKSVTFQVSGMNAYGYLKSEKGVHRLVRVSPFDSSGRRHTSFASADVMPEIDDDIEIQVNPDDIRVDTYRASGAGGQHVNKTSSAIRITHFPTGIVVQCQNERSQHSNKDMAMKMLKSKLLELKIEEQMAKLAEIRGDVKINAWGSQIRSYVFMPYTMVKDVRTGEETGNIQSVMDGNIDNFINAYLSWIHG
jgi:peptide chain release factor 2